MTRSIVIGCLVGMGLCGFGADAAKKPKGSGQKPAVLKIGEREGEVSGAVEVSDKSRKWTFVPVEKGSSPLPIAAIKEEGHSWDEMGPVSFPKFWIAEKMVTERDFAEVMGRPVREGHAPNQPVKEIEWSEALTYCERFTAKYAAQLPKNTFVSIPTLFEWGHAVKRLDGKTDLRGEVGTFLFSGDSPMFLHSAWKKDAAKKTEDFAVEAYLILRRYKHPFVGLRPVLIPVDGTSDAEGNLIHYRSVILVRHGFNAEGLAHFELALARGKLSADVAKSTRKTIKKLKQDEHHYDLEDWSGLVALSCAFAERKGYAINPYAGAWQMSALLGSEEDEETADAYRKAGIEGKLVRIADLPREIQADQNIGEEDQVLDPEKDEFHTVTITPDVRVQTLTCDFTGDGVKDLVVELYGRGGADGQNYLFYMKRADGKYEKVHFLQTVGLMALPKRGGGACAFLDVQKDKYPILSVRLLEFKNGKPMYEDANPDPFFMFDAGDSERSIYQPAPFINDYAWYMLISLNIWSPPLFWPWEQGKVRKWEEGKGKREKGRGSDE